jgi:rRNA pseudouridine-1189 N-methylase Emg1 (Nep1/Mra1 family)
MKKEKKMEPKEKEFCEEIELEGGKKIAFRRMKIKDYDLATEMAGRKATNQFTFAAAVQHELLKLLITSVDGKALTTLQREDLDQVLEIQDYNTCMEYMGEVAGKRKVVSRTTAGKSSGSK